MLFSGENAGLLLLLAYLDLLMKHYMKRTYIAPTAELFTWSSGPMNLLNGFSVDGEADIYDFAEGGELPDSE